MEALEYVTLLPAETEKLLSAGNAEAALVYLYIRATGDTELKSAEKKLRMPAQNLSWAKALLQRLGLLDQAASGMRYDPERAPVYSGEAVNQFAQQDQTFLPLQGEIANRLGRTLSGEDMKILLTIRDFLKLPPEVITMALTCCIQKNEYSNQLQGTNKTVNIRTLERECYQWANQGIDTLEKAAEYITRTMEMADPIGRVRKVLGLDRALIPAEREYISSWLQYGFTVEAIRSAYEKTILRTGKLTWPYMNKILLNWHEKNLHSIEEITAADRKQPAESDTGKQFQPGTQERASVGNLRSFVEDLRGQKNEF